ncbi:MAG TPA: hypothetical protein VI636_09365 [Candidatus Angelobacter sp.]
MEQETDALLPLDEPRVIAVKDGKLTYKFHFRRITADDWNQFFEGIHSSSRQEQQSQVNTIDISTPGIELVERTLVKVEGYVSRFDTAKPGWQQKVPPRHSGQLSWILRSVAQSEDSGESPFDPERQAVHLDAVWSQTGPGAQVAMFKGLVHYFNPPTAEDKRRYFRALSMTKVVGGSRKGTTIHPSRHRVLIEMYDRLIHSVDGYAVSGKPLANDSALIQREMDAYHKTQAVIALFFSAEPQESAEPEAA